MIPDAANLITRPIAGCCHLSDSVALSQSHCHLFWVLLPQL